MEPEALELTKESDKSDNNLIEEKNLKDINNKDIIYKEAVNINDNNQNSDENIKESNIILDKKNFNTIKHNDIFNNKENSNISTINDNNTKYNGNYISNLNADPYDGAFYYKNYKYLPYTTKSQFDNVKEITFICNINKQDVNNRKGLKRLCYGTIVFIKSEKKWYKKNSHSEYCINLHTKQNKELTDKIIDIEEFQKF